MQHQAQRHNLSARSSRGKFRQLQQKGAWV